MFTQQAATSLDIRIGATVACRDGAQGRVVRLVLEPHSRQVTHVVVQYGLPHHAVVVPIEQVARVQDDALVLRLDRNALAQLPRFAEVDYTLPDPSWPGYPGYPPGDIVFGMSGFTPSGVPLVAARAGRFFRGHTHHGMPAEEIPIGRGTRVTCREGDVGRLDHVLLDPQSDRIQALVVRKGHLLSKDVIVPSRQVAWIAEDEIHLEADRAALEELPAYHPAYTDEQITAAVQARVTTQEPTGGESAVTAQTREGVVHLSGVVHTEEEKQAAAAAAGAVAGVWQVENGLLVGGTVAHAVAAALAQDARTAEAVIEATDSEGSLTLRGYVRSVREKEAAVAIARAVEGVVAVIDELEVQTDAWRRTVPAPMADSQIALTSGLGLFKRY